MPCAVQPPERVRAMSHRTCRPRRRKQIQKLLPDNVTVAAKRSPGVASGREFRVETE